MSNFPLWSQWLIAALIVLGSLLALIGSFGLLTLGSFFQRIHAPTLVSTLGMWSITLANVLFFSWLGAQLYLHALLIILFIALTTPITTIFLMRAALFRERLAGRPGVPDSVSQAGHAATRPHHPQ